MLLHSIDKGLEAATHHLGADSDWVDVVQHLESARAVVKGSGPGGDLRKFSTARKPAILRFLLGPCCNVVSVRKDQSIKLKEEYHHFRNRSAYTMSAFAGLLLAGLMRAKALAEAHEQFTLTPLLIVGTQMFLCWLLYFYTASALRESVLKVNGSHIRPWWIHHHYWSVATCMLMLSLPVDSPSVVRSVHTFLWWAVLQGAVIVMQNRYQRRRMYTRVALGKSSAMDVVGGESSAAAGQLALLYPLLFMLQGLQSVIGVQMVTSNFNSFLSPEGYLDLEAKESDLWGSRGVALAGLCMLYMALMNFRGTVAAIVGRARAKEKALARIQVLRAKSQGSPHWSGLAPAGAVDADKDK
ncbi:transmembrane 120-like protein isoform B [Micractinium conductrix]|uniref:Transmembrane 120-like protein isoform B n=1 Tax=Micractinium conductrix TaxID=554055 RepID=A0A2P6V5G9_9CHLO|nr:transmembrane 120-like protein isoform B [Micractinium conductrix]|eukprot:PSC69322.1 transmembrane 120-like protein isoform B [Micractinium conductrix]